MTIGVDEAGRGPVLGSLFVAAVRADADDLPTGIDDSKRLSSSRREALAAELRADDGVSWTAIEVPPAEIDVSDTDLNTLTVEAAATAIEDVRSNRSDGVGESASGDGEVTTVIVDACDTDADRFGRRVAAAAGIEVDVIAEHGADETRAIVSAASVVAKVARDAHVRELAAEHGALGSGYPGDPETRRFLREYVAEHGGLPPFARASWATSQDVLAAAEQSALAEF